MPEQPRSDDTFVARPMRATLPAGPFGQRLERYLAALYAVGEDAEQRHDAALKDLRRDPGEAVIAIARASGCCEAANYPRRWALVYAAARMEHEAALAFFRELVLAPIPAGRPPVGHRNTVAREETILRTTAVDGVGRLAASGDKRALEMLHEFLAVPSISVRRASVQAILAVKPKAKKQLARLLPEEHRFLVDVKRRAVTEVRQVKDPRDHLRDPKASPKDAAPDLPDQGPRTPPRPGPKTRGR